MWVFSILQRYIDMNALRLMFYIIIIIIHTFYFLIRLKEDLVGFQLIHFLKKNKIVINFTLKNLKTSVTIIVINDISTK